MYLQDIDKYLTPHPLKEKASGRPVIMVHLFYFVTIQVAIVAKSGTNLIVGTFC